MLVELFDEKYNVVETLTDEQYSNQAAKMQTSKKGQTLSELYGSACLISRVFLSASKQYYILSSYRYLEAFYSC